MMHSTLSGRKTRQASIGRFRHDRLERRSADLEERQSMLLAVAEQVLRIVQDTRADLDATRGNRNDWGARLRAELAESKQFLSKQTIETLSGFLQKRLDDTTRARLDRKAFVRELKDDVVRIVSEDFRV